MKIYISNYRSHWISPYVILDKFFFWKKGYDSHEQEPPEWLNRICEWNVKFLDTIHPRIEYIKIDKYDTWNMDSTAGLILLPMLKQLKATKQGSPCTDDDDVPEHLKSTSAPKKENDYDIDANHFLRWDYIMDEMIWAFEQYTYDWEAQYTSGEADYEFIDREDGMTEMKKGPKDTREYDWEGMQRHQLRMTNGFRLMGKYWQGLWD